MKLLQSLTSVLDMLTIPLGRWFGVPVYLHWSWVLFFLFVLTVSPAAALAIGGLFFIVLLHECGHCLAGQYYGCYIRDIVLYPFGGAAAMKISDKPSEEMVIALAGPAVNVLLMPVLFFLGQYHQILATIALYNVVLLIFNLIPAFPMDGGRVLRAILSMFLRDHLKATKIAARIGQGFCLLFAVYGIFVGAIGLVVIGVFIALAAEQEIEAAKARQRNVEGLRRFLAENGIDAPDEVVQESARMLERMSQRNAELERNRPRDES